MSRISGGARALASVWLLSIGSGSMAAELDHILFQVIRRGDTELVASLLRQGTPVNLRDADGTSPLMVAALWGDAESVAVLLEYGADPNAKNEIGVTPLIWGAADVEKVRLLLAAGADPKASSALGNTPLIVAAASPEGLPAVRLLLEHGGDLAAHNKRGSSPLRSALLTGDRATAELLLDRGALTDTRPGASADVSVAAGRGDYRLVKLLLDHGADPNAGTGRSALNAALLAQKPRIARLLIEHGAQFDRRLSPGRVPSFVLSAYTEIDDPAITRLLIEKGADPTVANQHDETALTWARKRGHPELIAALVSEGVPEGTRNSKPVPARQVRLDGSQDQRLLRAAIQKSISLLQHSSDVFLENRETCVSCHHQNLPAVAVGWARDRGFEVDQGSIQRMIEAQLRSWRPRIDRAYQMDRPVPVAPRFIGYGVLGFAALGFPPEEATTSLLWYLAAIQRPEGYWAAGMLRPPMGGGDIVATVLAMRSLQLASLTGRAADFRERVVRAREWLRAAVPKIHQDRACRLLGLAWAGVSPTELTAEIQELLAEQRADGGWAQLPALTSDAWATGQTLVALHAAGLPTSHAAYRRAMEYLLATQFDDGSWYVATRTWPFQSHFDSEFPHGKDQWVSAPATAWATMGLLLAVEPTADVIVAGQTVAAEPAQTRVEAETVAAPAKSAASQEREVDFVTQIKPLLTRSCVSCHSGADPKGGFRVTTRRHLLQGGESGAAAVTPGQGDQSQLVRFVSGKVEDLEMPPLASRKKFPALTADEIRTLRRWIEQGASWPEGLTLKVE